MGMDIGSHTQDCVGMASRGRIARCKVHGGRSQRGCTCSQRRGGCTLLARDRPPAVRVCVGMSMSDRPVWRITPEEEEAWTGEPFRRSSCIFIWTAR